MSAHDRPPVFGPIKIKGLCWAERQVTYNPGRDNEHTETERSRETFLLTALAPEELMSQLVAAIEENPNPALEARTT